MCCDLEMILCVPSYSMIAYKIPPTKSVHTTYNATVKAASVWDPWTTGTSESYTQSARKSRVPKRTLSSLMLQSVTTDSAVHKFVLSVFSSGAFFWGLLESSWRFDVYTKYWCDDCIQTCTGKSCSLLLIANYILLFGNTHYFSTACLQI